LGIAVGFFVARAIEFVVRVIPVWEWIGELPRGELAPDLKKRMFKFSGNNIVLLLLNLIVWDRSDVVLLKFLSKDIAQISFFAVGFNLVEKALIVPQSFAAGVNVTINAQYGRDRSRLSSLVSSSARYLLLFSVPLLLGLAAISAPAIRVAYGWQYIPAIPVLAVAAMMALPKPLLMPAQQMLQANEQQKFLIFWGISCGLLNIGLDWLLIPKMGALGAAIGNGGAQLLGVIGPWFEIRRRYGVHLDASPLLKTLVAGILMASSVVLLHQFLHPVLTLAVGIPLGALVFFVSLRVLRALNEEDVARLLQFKTVVPSKIQPTFIKGISMVSGVPLPETQPAA
jgi:O-antigen/teichoic acid export membrane protein